MLTKRQMALAFNLHLMERLQPLNQLRYQGDRMNLINEKKKQKTPKPQDQIKAYSKLQNNCNFSQPKKAQLNCTSLRFTEMQKCTFLNLQFYIHPFFPLCILFLQCVMLNISLC